MNHLPHLCELPVEHEILTALCKEMIAVRHRAAALLVSVLATAAATLLIAGPAQAAARGFQVTITQLPQEFEAGAPARTVEVVASTDNQGRCRKVRWSMVVKVDGVDLDQVKVNRVEDDGDFPVQVRADGDTARLTDVQLDPGSLCPGKTVTARYQVAFDDDADGRVTFNAQAFDAGTRLLEQASATSRVGGGRAAASPSPTPSATPSEEPSEEPSAEPSDEVTEEAVAAPGGTSGGAPAANPASAGGGIPSLLGPGLIVGALLVFAGVGLLLRIRMRAGRAKAAHHLPTGFYPTR